MTQRICSVQEGDCKFVKTFEEELEMLVGMVDEMFTTTPSTLLSPVLRRLIVEKALLVKQLHGKIQGRIVVDNPGEPL